MLLAFSGFICIFVSPLLLLMNYLLQSEMTGEITDDCCRGWMGAFLLLVIILFFPDFQSSFSLMFPSDNRPKKKMHCKWNLSTVSRKGNRLCCWNDCRNGKQQRRRKKNKQKNTININMLQRPPHTPPAHRTNNPNHTRTLQPVKIT